LEKIEKEKRKDRKERERRRKRKRPKARSPRGRRLIASRTTQKKDPRLLHLPETIFLQLPCQAHLPETKETKMRHPPNWKKGRFRARRSCPGHQV